MTARLGKRRDVRTLAYDIGGTGIKGAVLDARGEMISPRIHLATPHPATPANVMAMLLEIAQAVPAFERVSAGFPGVVRAGRILSAPNLGTDAWRGFRLAEALAEHLGKPVRVLNDAEVQGFGVIAGQGLECVLTLGTGVGSALFQHGRLAPHLELGQHPIRNNKTYDDYLGRRALKEQGRKRWSRRVQKAIGIVRTLVNFDKLYLGGGNARHLEIELPRDVEIVSNRAGITGGVRLWDAEEAVIFAQAIPADAHRAADRSRADAKKAGRKARP
jgi:polyphosphate glucokinase